MHHLAKERRQVRGIVEANVIAPISSAASAKHG
jgi:hypothetical protein